MTEPDEAMVLRLLAGPCRDARRIDRRAAVEALLTCPSPENHGQIARRVGVSVRTVDRRAAALGMTSPRPVGTRDRVLELGRQGVERRHIARAVGVHPVTAGRHIRALRQQGVL